MPVMSPRKDRTCWSATVRTRTLPVAAAVKAWLRVTPARPVTTPDEAACSALLRVMLALGAIAVMTVLAGMPTPVTI